MKRFGLILTLIGLFGCSGGTGIYYVNDRYVLEYPPPRAVAGAPVEYMLRVERFSAARLCMDQAMVFRKTAFKRIIYAQRRWQISPADMVSDLLRRDLRHSGLFRAVFSARDPEEPRFVLGGEVEEFLEEGNGKKRKALLAATVTLQDISQRDFSAKLIFQKRYRAEAALRQEGPEFFAEAMSAAMSEFSAAVVADMRRVLKKNDR